MKEITNGGYGKMIKLLCPNCDSERTKQEIWGYENLSERVLICKNCGLCKPVRHLAKLQ